MPRTTEAGVAASRRRRAARARLSDSKAVRLSRARRSPRARSLRSTRSASPASTSSRPRSGTTRWAASPRRCWAASMSTSMASPAWRSISTSACSAIRTPLRLSLDVRVQAVVRDELSKAMDEFQAIGACGIVMDVNTGEVLAMVSLPDYDANDFRTTPRRRPLQPRGDRRCTSRAARSSCRPRRWRWMAASSTSGTSSTPRTESISAASPSPTSRASIAGSICRRCWPTRPISAPRISALDVGAERQRAWLKMMGMFGRVGIELPEAGHADRTAGRGAGRRSSR